MNFLRERGHYFLGVLVLSLILIGCGGTRIMAEDSPDEQVNKIVGRQNQQYIDNQPIPFYEYSAQRDIVIQLYNITVPNLVDTWTIFYEMNLPTDQCKSRGYPIPYGVQLTASQYMKTNNGSSSSHDSQALPQPEPSGLYTEGLSTSASWVLCDFGQGIEAVYAEGNVRSYAHPVVLHFVQEQGQDGKTYAAGQIEHLSGAPSVVLDLSRAGSAGGNIDPNTSEQNK